MSDKGLIEQAARFRIDAGPVDLVGRNTVTPHLYRDKRHYHERMRDCRRRLRKLQRKLFAGDHHALLVVVQGIDAAGKNGLIRRVFGGLDPAGLHVWSFGAPNDAELLEDWLRRYQRRLPARGEIGVFNRSYYEITLSARVHPQWLHARGYDDADIAREGFWENYFRNIRFFERYLMDNGVKVVKIMPHISPEAQRGRLLDRLHKRSKQWKLTVADCEDSHRWREFATVYGECIGATASPETPWYVLPADDKRGARLLAAGAVIDGLESLRPDWPEPDAERLAELADIGAHLGVKTAGHGA